MNLTRNRALRAFVVRTALKVVAALVALFVVFWIAIPNMIDAHDDVLLWAAVALGFLGVLGAGWLGVTVCLSIVRFRKTPLNLEGPTR